MPERLDQQSIDMFLAQGMDPERVGNLRTMSSGDRLTSDAPMGSGGMGSPQQLVAALLSKIPGVGKLLGKAGKKAATKKGKKGGFMDDLTLARILKYVLGYQVLSHIEQEGYRAYHGGKLPEERHQEELDKLPMRVSEIKLKGQREATLENRKRALEQDLHRVKSFGASQKIDAAGQRDATNRADAAGVAHLPPQGDYSLATDPLFASKLWGGK